MGRWLDRVRAEKASVGCVSAPPGVSGDAKGASVGCVSALPGPLEKKHDALDIPWEAWEQRGLAIMASDLPPVPFTLRQGRYVNDIRRLFEDLHRDLRRGPEGPSAVSGELQADIEALEQLVAARKADQGKKE